MQFVTIQDNPISSSVITYMESVRVSEWTHSRTATHGFDKASFDLVMRPGRLEEFFYSGIGRMVTRYSDDGNTVIWQGYINEMVLTQPGMRVRQSLDNMYNRVSVKYTELDTSTNPPGETANTYTAQVNNTNSQDKYGIKETIYSPPVGKLTSAMAIQLRDTFLDVYREPVRGGDVVMGASKPKLRVICKGYKHTLDWRVYNQTANSGTQNANDQISDILASGDLFIASSELSSNTTQVQVYYNDDLTMLEIIDNIAALGDASNNRWLAYVKPGRVLVYEQATTVATKYYRRLSDPRQAIHTSDGRLVPYWEVEPNAWLKTMDIKPLLVDPASQQDNPQLMYIESVEWTESSNSLSLTGSRGDQMQVLVARASEYGETLL